MDKSRPRDAPRDDARESLRPINVNKPEALLALLENIHGLPTKPPSLFLDIERINKIGVTFLCLYVPLKQALYRVKIDGDRSLDLTTASASGESLKSILESESIPKVVFDVRPVSNTLFRLHNISLDGMRDLQLMELAGRGAKHSKKYVAGFAKCVELDVPASNEVRRRWLEGTDDASEYRNLNIMGHAHPRSMKRVELFPVLWDAYYSRLRRPAQAFWLAQSEWEAKVRVTASQYDKPSVEGNGGALGPEVWYNHDQRQYAMDNWNRDLSIGIEIGK